MSVRNDAAERNVVAVQCRARWSDTDASGHYHHSTVIRWVEAAEAELFHRLGMLGLYGQMPRVHYEVDYCSRVWFGDLVDVCLRVERVGRSSLVLSFNVGCDDKPVAAGRVIMVHTSNGDGARASQPWPLDERDLLTGPLPEAESAGDGAAGSDGDGDGALG